MPTDLDPSRFPAGTVGVVSSDLARYTKFSISLQFLVTPPNTKLDWQTGINVALSCNRVLERMHGEWVWIMGDDHVFAPHTLLRLLDRNVDVVVPLCAYRRPPFAPVVFSGEVDGKPGNWKVLNWIDFNGKTGLQEVYVAGSAGMLIRKNVIQALSDPWFEVGQERSDGLNEDITFCKKVRAAGFKIYVDLDTVIGHIGQITVWPRRSENGRYGVSFDFGRYNNQPTIISVFPEPVDLLDREQE